MTQRIKVRRAINSNVLASMIALLYQLHQKFEPCDLSDEDKTGSPPDTTSKAGHVLMLVSRLLSYIPSLIKPDVSGFNGEQGHISVIIHY